MTMHQRVWRLSIVLAFLLLRQSQPTDVSTESPHARDDQQYEVIDVAQQQGAAGGDASRSGGQTTRIFTTGAVDDSFWLKYLGEDFRHAVHLQVGGNDRYDGIYNMTEDRSAYNVQHDSGSKAHPVEGDKLAEVAQNDVAETKIEHADRKNSTAASREVTADTLARSKAKNETSSDKDDSYERVISIDGGNMHFRNKFYNFNFATGKQEPNKYTPNTKSHYTNSKYSPTHTYTQTQPHRYTKNRNMKRGSNPDTLGSSVVVNLPDTQKIVHQLDDNHAPVVVKMPPVIYHSQPIYKGEEDRHEVDTNGNTDVNTHTHTHTDSHSHTEHAQNVDALFSQQAQYTPQHPLPSYYNSPPPYQDISPYSSQDAYRSSDLMTSEKSDNGAPNSLDYIMSKASASYGNTMDYTRIIRSSQDLFNQGL